MADRFKNIIAKIPFVKKNFQLLPTVQGAPQNIPVVENNAHSPRNFMIPLQLQRIKQDVQTWRLAIEEAENAYYPHRFRMQQLFVDTILEGHTLACINARKNMALLKEFKIGKKNSDGRWIENKDATALFTDKSWFSNLLNYILDAQFYGYSLIQLGDLLETSGDYRFRNLTIIKRWHVSPDRLQLVQIPYQTRGLQINDINYFNTWQFKNHDKSNAVSIAEDADENGVPFNDWMIYVDTPSDNGSSICGNGLLYNVALYAILLRNNLSHNADYNQMFSSPLRHVKTTHEYDSQEYKDLETAMANMGAFNYLITGSQEEIEFIQANTGTGYQSYENLEVRCQKMISKIILGHANALDAQSTALGGGSSGKKIVDEDASPEGQAKSIIEKRQDQFLLNVLNDNVLPKLRNLGFKISEDLMFYTTNDKEEFELRKKNDEANLATAQVWQTAKNGGLKLSAEKFTEITGIEAEEVAEPTALPPTDKGAQMRMINKLKSMYKR